CLSNWVEFEGKCYKFVFDPKRIFEEADSACWMYGATLVSINNAEEHRFISEWLTRFDGTTTNYWLTSGLYVDRIITWQGDNNQIHIGPTYWNMPPISNSYQSIIVYTARAQDGAYGWRTLTASIPANYICEISKANDWSLELLLQRDFDYGLSNVNQNVLKMGPKIISEPENIVVVGDLPIVSIECVSSGNSPPTYSWARGPGLNETVSSLTNSRYTVSGGRIMFQNPSATEDFNDYQCKAENEFGSVLSQKAKLLFGYLHDFPPIPPEDVYAQMFEGTRLACSTPSALPEVRYEWFKFTTNSFVTPGHPYQFVSNSGYLYMSEVQPTDSKKYYCLVTLAAPSGYRLVTYQPPSKTNPGIWLRISGTKVGDYGPIIHTHVFPTPALRGSNVRMECIAYGRLPLSYTWRRQDGRPLPLGATISDANRVLIIRNAQLQDEGDYICTCSKESGSANKVISLVLESSPYFAIPLNDMHFDPGVALKWPCKAVGRPAVTYTWYKNAQILQNIPGEIEIHQNYLYIRAVDKSRDEGMYQCAATNVHGTTFSTGQLRVLSFKPNFNRYPFPEQRYIPLGGHAILPCRVEGAPLPEVAWWKDGQNMNLPRGETAGRIGIASNFDLVFKELLQIDQGYYTCKATNKFGDAENTTFVFVTSGIEMSVTPANTQVVVNNTAFIYCEASMDLKHFEIIYEWKFYNMTIDFRNHPHYEQILEGSLSGLYIRKAQLTHNGLYTCTAMTSLHSVTRSAFLTVVGPPGEPAGVYVDPLSLTPHSARIIWTIGTINGAPETYFIIEGATEYDPQKWKKLSADIPAVETLQQGSGLRTDQRSYPVGMLIPNTGYSFRVMAMNSYGIGPPSHGSNIVKIPQTKPIIAPRAVSGGGGSVGTLTITWEPLDISEQCGPGIGYNVYFRLKETYRDAVWQKVTLNGNMGEYSHIVGEQNYYLEYEVMVAAFNTFGAGPNSSIALVYSAEGIPTGNPKMQDLYGYNSTAAVINWIPVPDTRDFMKGHVVGYTIIYYHEATPDIKLQKNVYGQQSTALLVGLQQDSNYYVSMYVFNLAARGPKSGWRLVETLHKAPSLYPTNVRVWSHDANSVRVTWRGLSTRSNEESLLGYQLMYWKASEDMRSFKTVEVPMVDEAILEDIQPNEVYIVRVLGHSPGGRGQRSPAVYFTLGGQVPVDPSVTEYKFAGDGNKASNKNEVQIMSVYMAIRQKNEVQIVSINMAIRQK
ncbi:hypothetical protein ACJMK2_008118, partial [Sinanodonta woodiana]